MQELREAAIIVPYFNGSAIKEAGGRVVKKKMFVFLNFFFRWQKFRLPLSSRGGGAKGLNGNVFFAAYLRK